MSSYKLKKSVLNKDIKVLDELIGQFIESGMNMKSGVAERWSALEAMYRQERGSSGLEVFKGNETRPTPLFRSRAKRLIDTVHTDLLGTQPYCQAVPHAQSQQKADALEKAVQAVMDTSRYPEYQRLALVDAANCGVGFVWSPLTDKGVIHHHIHPGRMIVLPNTSHDFGKVFAIGHMIQIPAFELLQMQAEGKIRKDFDVIPSEVSIVRNDGQSNEGLSLTENYSLPSDWQNVEVWRVLVKLNIGGETKWWNIWYSNSQQRVMSVEEYPYDTPWYTVYRLHYEPSRFWPETPVMQSLQSIQHQHSTLSAVLEQGALAKTQGALVLTGALANGKEIETLEYGSIIRLNATAANVSAIPIYPAIDLSIVPTALQKLEGDADQALQVSKTSVGQELNDATATEVQALQASQAQAENAYASCAADALETHAELMASYWKKSWTTMFVRYGHKIDKSELMDAMKVDVEWKASGRSADASPQVQMQKLQGLYQLSQNPMSVLDPTKVERRIVMEFGINNYEDLLKENNDQIPEGGTSALVGGPQGPGGVSGPAQGMAASNNAGPMPMQAGPGDGLGIAG